jgi:hypothetical protein
MPVGIGDQWIKGYVALKLLSVLRREIRPSSTPVSSRT